MNQQGDVLLYQTVNDGDITVTNGIVQMAGGLETAVYLSLFGGNEEDDGSDGTPYTWWGNLTEVDRTKHMRSETQNLLTSLPLTSANLRRVHDAVLRDLTWLKTSKVAKKIDASVSVPELNKVYIQVQIDDFNIEFYENWKMQA